MRFLVLRERTPPGAYTPPASLRLLGVCMPPFSLMSKRPPGPPDLHTPLISWFLHASYVYMPLGDQTPFWSFATFAGYRSFFGCKRITSSTVPTNVSRFF